MNMQTNIMRGSFYTAARGGHAPGDLRDAFEEAIDAYEVWNVGEPEPSVELREQDVPISKVFGLLWNCSDILSNRLWDQIANLDGRGEIKRRTYGAAARWLKGQIKA